MKNAILLCCVTVLFIACKKERYCWQCTMTATTTYDSSYQGYRGEPETKATSDMCDKTEDEIKEFEKQYTGIHTVTNDNGKFTVDEMTTCTNTEKL